MRNGTRIILSCCMLLLNATFSFSQSMTDADIIQYVMEQKSEGKDQQSIVSELTRKGVTVNQLVRLRNKYEAQSSLLGADDLIGNETKSPSRLRTEKKENKGSDIRRNSMLRFSNTENGYDNTDLNREIGFLDIDSILYYRNLLKEKKVFGRDIFNNTELSFEPNLNMATPESYILGAGDAIFIDIWGASQQTLEGTITPDGTITFDEIGPVKLAGLSIKDAEKYVKSKIGSYYADCEVALSLGETRSIVVQVLGEVSVPGTYTLSSMATAFNALYAAGGIGEIGTMRDIKVYRNGRELAVIDVYDFLINGNSNSNVSLQDNDVILVGSYNSLVCIQGRVRRPMFYELKAGETLQQLVRYSGGFTGDAYARSLRVIRKSGEEYSVHTVLENQFEGFAMMDCDSVYVDSTLARFSNMIEITGAVMHPGKYELGEKIGTVKQLIEMAGGLREDAFIERAVMHRIKNDLSLEAVPIDVNGIMDGSTMDLTLNKNDVVFIPSSREMEGKLTFKINGEVQYPGTYLYAEKTTVKDLILQAGGLTRSASTAKIDIYRHLYDPSAIGANNIRSEVFTFNLNNGFILEDSDFYLMPDDEVQVRKSPVFNDIQNVQVSGQVNFEGEYAIKTDNFRMSDLVESAGGLANSAYPNGARLLRKMNDEEKERRSSAIKQSQIKLYEQQIQMMESNQTLRELTDTLLAMKLDLGDYYDIAIDLEKAIKAPGSEYDIVLRDGDKLVVPQINTTVKITGDVMCPISVNYVKGKNLSYYIKNAGGFSKNASKRQTYVVYMNRSVDKLGRRAAAVKIEPGCEIVVPSKPQKIGEMTVTETVSLATSVASLATMIIAIINIVK